MFSPTVIFRLVLFFPAVAVVAAGPSILGLHLSPGVVSTISEPVVSIKVGVSSLSTAVSTSGGGPRPTSTTPGVSVSPSTHNSSSRPSTVVTTTGGPSFITPFRSRSPVLRKRAAIPACLKTVELSCLNLAANCISTVNSDTFNNLWGISSCVAAATCYDVGDLITSVECQTGFNVTNAAQASLDYDNIYAGIVGNCAFVTGGCPITQQNYIDFYYGELSAIDTANYPAYGLFPSWLSFDDWLHYSSYPSVTTTLAPPVPTYTEIEWNPFNRMLPADPNPAPPSGAVSETFVKASTTVIIVIPTTTTVVVVADATITVAPGGQPINGPVPSDPNVIPPASATSVTFTAPPSYTSVVAVPTTSNAPPQNITGPFGDKNKNGDDWWLLLFGGLIGGLLPADIGIPGGTTPTAAPPAGWTGPWTDPHPTSTSTSTSTNSASSSSSSSFCPQPTAPYALSDDTENADWEDEGTDPDLKRKRRVVTRSPPRRISVKTCNIQVANSGFVALKAGEYYSIGLKALGGVNAALSVTQRNTSLSKGILGAYEERHRRLIPSAGWDISINSSAHLSSSSRSCQLKAPRRIQDNVFNFYRADGSNMGLALVQAIDQANYPVLLAYNDEWQTWSKSNVVNQNKATAASPPQSSNINDITNFVNPANISQIQDVEYFARNFAALGSYFGNTAATFQATALRVQNLLAEITPDSPDANLPTEFNSWLRGLISNYPTGCTSRATNVFNYYVNRMNFLSVATGVTPVPACFPLYHSTNPQFNPQTFNWANLIPPAPALPSCDIPGTEGRISPYTVQGNPPYQIGTLTILGSGNTNHYALGSGTSLAGVHYLGNDLGVKYANCQGVWEVDQSLPIPGLPDANIALNCDGGLNNAVNAPFDWVINNQQLECVLLWEGNTAGGTLENSHTICGGTVAAATDCSDSLIQVVPYPQGYVGTAEFVFYPM
ncbi:hypothetical protein DFH09DRAFT_1071651 [Mycena vulgaris]|nr:hypothetical protein DFH09DRAFT_1071651 [Mycena vulgaris]